MFKTKSCRPITYYGSEYTADIQRKNGENQAIHSINRLFEILLEAWCKETAFPSCQKDYDFYNDPTYGQCAITAMLVCDMFGGTIHKVRVSGGGTHYFNKINNHYIDLTATNLICIIFMLIIAAMKKFRGNTAGKTQTRTKNIKCL